MNNKEAILTELRITGCSPKPTYYSLDELQEILRFKRECERILSEEEYPEGELMGWKNVLHAEIDTADRPLTKRQQLISDKCDIARYYLIVDCENHKLLNNKKWRK